MRAIVDYAMKAVHAVAFRFPWEASPSESHDKVMNVSGGYGYGLWVDQFPVTCSQYAKFLEDTGYVPRDPFNCESNPFGWRYNQ